MRRLVLFSLLFLPALTYGQDDVITRFFSQYESRKDFTTIYITSKMFSLIAQIPQDENEDDMMNIIRRLNGVRILSTDNSPEAEKLYEEAYRLLPKNGFEDLMVIKDGSEDVKFLVHEKGEVISEFVMISHEDNKFTLLSMTGDLRLKDISKLSKTLDINGLDKYDKNDHKQ